jgi:hypothetical protein
MTHATGAKRVLGPWLVGLYLASQILGIVPLMSAHTAHVAETHIVHFEDNGRAASNSHSQHRRDDADGPAQHHELQDLSGVLACPANRCETGLVSTVVTTSALGALIAGEPILLDRPPKPFLSV